MESGLEYNVAIIGGGPAGSTAAALLAKSGRKVVVLEKDAFPRFHIGESLLPHSMKTFERLGLAEKLRGAGFIEKHGGQIASGCGERDVKFYFKDGFRSKTQTAYQVVRSDFDKLMLDHAGECGADIFEQTAVTGVEFHDSIVAIETENSRGGKRTVTASYVIDCSGRKSLIARKEAKVLPYPGLQKFSVYAHYENVFREDGIDGTLTRMVRADDRWFWMIPLPGDRMSVGVVMDTSHFKSLKLTPEEVLDESIRQLPVMRDRMIEARRVSEVRSCSDYSYRSSRMARDRWILAGDAAGFIDPIFSSGVFLAILSGESAADILHECLDKPQRKHRLFRRYEKRMNSVMDLYLDFVKAWYRQEFIEVFLNPVQTLQLAPAINSLLAGNTGKAFSMRWRLSIFRTIVFLQRFAPLCPRLDLSGTRLKASPRTS